MFKLKLINKPKMIKLKCGFSFPNIVLANLQEKEVNPTTEKQEIVADKEYSALSKVTVNPIPDEYIIPSGEIEKETPSVDKLLVDEEAELLYFGFNL